MHSDRPASSHRDRLLAGALTCLREKGYAHTTARDLVAASGTNLHSIGYHFGSKEALLDEALGECFRLWTTRVEEAAFGTPARSPREQLHAALAALIDSFDELRPQVLACVEAIAPAARSETLRAKLAASYAEARQAAAAMVTRACTDLGITPPEETAALTSLLIAIGDGLMLQWLADPAATPDARQTINALAMLTPFLADEPSGSETSPAPDTAGEDDVETTRCP
ncbi:MAG TPA: TetR/AcrR family transcriptional regulator [Streptosporangiaceae bacterium]|nr:TetR/AcrR family transcriptional regulator [Streptosporangiaceae bacterium]